MVRVHPVSEIVSQVGEGPLWHYQTSSVFWVDIPGKVIHSAELRTGKSSSIKTPMMVSAVALAQDNTLIAATQSGFAKISLDGKNLSKIEEFLTSDMRMNDGKVDPAGRFWAGSLALDFEKNRGSLYVLEKDSTRSTAIEKLTLSNGMGWSPDERYFYFIDSIPGTLFRYNFDCLSGTISNKTVLVEFDPKRGIPDGLCITRDGLILIALWDGGRLELYEPSGKKLEEFVLPVKRPTSCCFAGDDFSTLIVTTASKDIDCTLEPLAGRILALSDTALSGLPTYRYG